MLLAILIPLLALGVDRASSHIDDARDICACGYGVDNRVFTDMQETDFTKVYDPNLPRLGWIPQNWTIPSDSGANPLGKNISVDNILANPQQAKPDNVGLQLWARPLRNNLVGGAEIQTLRSDLLYGSFRVGLEAADIKGTVNAFFFYHNDSQEIDIELLSREFSASNSSVNLVVQKELPIQASWEGNAVREFQVAQVPFDPSHGFHEYRIDWFPEKITFYIDGLLMQTMNKSVPVSPGRLVLNHWSNGNPNWSGGPPERATAMRVMYVNAYFNSSLPNRQEYYRTRCPAAQWDSERVCAVPTLRRGFDVAQNPHRPIQPSEPFFFSSNPDMSVGQIVYGGYYGGSNPLGFNENHNVQNEGTLCRKVKHCFWDFALTGWAIVRSTEWIRRHF